MVGVGVGLGKHVLDDFAVCCRNVATCVVDVASHHIVGEVRLQNNVLGVHVHLEKRNGERQGACQEAAPHLVIGGEVDTDVTERKTDVGDRGLGSQREGWERRGSCGPGKHLLSRRLETSAEPGTTPGDPCTGTVASFCPRESWQCGVEQGVNTGPP